MPALSLTQEQSGAKHSGGTDEGTKGNPRGFAGCSPGLGHCFSFHQGTWDVLALAEVCSSPAAVVSVLQQFTNCAHELSSSSSSLLFKTPGFCHEPFPRHFLLSPSQSTITCKTELSPVFCAAQEEERQAVATACVAFAACGASMSQELSSPPYQGFPTRAFHNVAEQMF